MSKLRKYKVGDLGRITIALNLLRRARAELLGARSPRALAAVRHALKSTEGARRHADRILSAEADAHAKRRERDGIPPCAAAMGCLCAGHARGNPIDFPCDTREEV